MTLQLSVSRNNNFYTYCALTFSVECLVYLKRGYIFSVYREMISFRVILKLNYDWASSIAFISSHVDSLSLRLFLLQKQSQILP